MIPITVYLDMDGVITDFSSGVMKHFNVPATPDDIKQWDWFADFGLDEKNVSEFLSTSREFWANLEWTPEGRLLFSVLCDIYEIENIWLLTTPWKNNIPCREGKLDWIKKHMPEMESKVYFAHDKSIYANERAVLFDDREETIEKFRAAGGTGILVPRTWNSKGKNALST